MNGLHWFFLIVVVLLGGAQVLSQAALAPVDLFAPDQETRRQRLFNQPLPAFIAYKLGHASRAPRYDLGFFGNSRIMPAGQDAFAGYGRVFNFFVPGSSIRTSVAMAERLHGMGRLPKTVVIMVDHFAINTQQVQVMPFLTRLKLGMADMFAGFRMAEISPRDTVRMIWRHVFEEWNQFTGSLNLERLRRTLSITLGAAGASLEAPHPIIHLDGRGLENRSDTAHIPPAPAEQAHSLIPGYFVYDLERLAALAPHARIVLYESPLEPTVAAGIEKSLPTHAAANRALFLQTCKRLSLTCHPAPILVTPGVPGHWSDASHPPVDILERYLASLL